MVKRSKPRRGAGRSPSKRRKSQSKSSRGWINWLLLFAFALGLAGLFSTLYLDQIVRAKFEGKRWAVPARVYGRPLELFAGAPLKADDFVAELRRLGYRKGARVEGPGTYAQNRQRFVVRTRDFRFWDQDQASRSIELNFDGSTLAQMRDRDSGEDVPLVRLEPPLIGSIHPAHNEDRILLRREDVPPVLVDALQAVEDRSFYDHHGVDPKAILRAMWSNLRAGEVVQGGSTLTQQLVKNFYLTQDRTLVRKMREAVMALLLDYHYDKDEILEAYANEIFLGQDGPRAIHGFGLASRFYFARPLNELGVPEVALLVGLVRGPSHYNPLRYPDRALERRNLVITVLRDQGVIDEAQAEAALAAPLGVAPKGTRQMSTSGYPAFMDVVRRQLRRDYAEEDLSSEGLRIFTTLDPGIQEQAEEAVAHRLTQLEKDNGLTPNKLEAAVVVASPDGGEIKAIVGGRQTGYSGFNRALDAHRHIGSLVKPAVYLAAWSQPSRYTLMSGIEDSPIEITTQDGQLWSPENYEKESHGLVPLHYALAQSFNQATVRLGMDVGVSKVVATLHALGIERKLNAYPSLLLGAFDLSPMEVAQMYQTLATGGFTTPLRAIREVTDAQGEPLNRYPLEVNQTLEPAAVYLVDKTLQEVVASGTGKTLSRWLSPELGAAGKTGTTDDLRDSWFAGFTGDTVAVVWVGRDDNTPAGLSGGRGALQVWGDMMSRIGPAPLVLTQPEDVDLEWVELTTGLRANEDCEGSAQFPFVRGSAPTAEASCMQQSNNPFWRMFE